MPAVVHLDYGENFEDLVKALHYGFISVMFNESTLPYEENVRRSQEIVEIAQALGVSVEAGWGHVGGAEGGPGGEEDAAVCYTDPDQVDMAVQEFVGSIINNLVLGNVHEDVFPTLVGAGVPEDIQSLGLIITFSVASGCGRGGQGSQGKAWGDTLGVGMGGKAFVLLSGDVGAVQVALESGARVAREEGLLARAALLANPDPPPMVQDVVGGLTGKVIFHAASLP